MEPDKETPKKPTSTDDSTAAVAPEDYDFIFVQPPEAQKQERKSIKQWFLALPRAKQVVFIAGVCILIFTITVGALLIAQPSNTAKQTIIGTADTNGDGVINNGDSSPVFGDTNGDGIVDEYDTGDTESASSTTSSWWQKIISAGETSSQTDDGDSSDSYGDTATTNEEETTDGTDGTDGSTDDDATDPETDDGEETVPADEAPDETEIDDPIDTTPDPTPTYSEGTSLTVASWNVLGLHNNGTHAKKGVQTIFSSAQVIGLQEVGTGNNKSIRSAIGNLASSKIGVYQPHGNTPIVWNATMYSKKSSGYIVIKGHSEYKVATYVKLRNKATGQQFYVFNIHMVVGTGDKSKESCSTRICLAYKQEIKAFSKFIAKRKSENIPIFVTGDYNANYRVDKSCKLSWYPCRAFRALDFYSGYSYTGFAGISKSASSVSSGDRVIDYVFSWKRADVTPVSMDIVAPNASCHRDSYGQNHCWNNSDHKPVLFTVKLTK
jgi:endonuclease/exonuclease/phosphatase family metal-dependent hydrolase